MKQPLRRAWVPGHQMPEYPPFSLKILPIAIPTPPIICSVRLPDFRLLNIEPFLPIAQLQIVTVRLLWLFAETLHVEELPSTLFGRLCLQNGKLIVQFLVLQAIRCDI